MGVDVDNIKDEFLNRVCDRFNEEVYFVKSCYKYPSKSSLLSTLNNLSLRIYFEQNNHIVLGGKSIKYCDKDTRRKIKLNDISLDTPDITLINNYVTEEKWSKLDW